MKLLLFSLIAAFSVSFTYADNTKTFQFDNAKNNLSVQQVSTAGFNMNLSIAKAYVTKIQHKEGDFFTIQTNGFTKSPAIGNPDLPVLSKLIEVPLGAKVKIVVKSKSTEIIDLNKAGFTGKCYPAQPSVPKCGNPKDIPFEYNSKIYTTNEFYSHELAAYHESGIMRGTRLGRVAVNPFRYNPVTNQLKIFTNLEIQVVFKGGDDALTRQMKKRYGNRLYDRMFTKTLNHVKRDKPINQNDPVKMLIIADRMFETSLEPFVEWKTISGIETTVRYTDETAVGNTTSSIKSYLQTVYDNATAEDPAPTFILLVGDIGEIPAFDGNAGSHVTDLYYFCYDGTGDNLPDVNYGRFSAQNTTDLDNIIEKTLIYEKYEMSDPSYLDHTLLVAGNDESYEDVYGNGAMWYVDNYYFNDAHGITDHLFLQDPPNGNAAVSDSIINNVNNGIAWGNYTAHCGSSGWGTPSFNTSDVSALTNNEKYGVLVGNCCLSNKFDDSECFGEALLRAADKGTVGYLGGSNSTYWDEDYWWAVGNGSPVEEPAYEDFGNGCYDLMQHEIGADQPYSDWAPTLSQVNQAGQLAIEASSSSRKVYFWEIYHLMGDPSLMPYTGVPDALSPNYQATIPVNVTSLDVSNLPQYANVALSDEGTLIATAKADGAGTASLSFDAFNAPTNAELIITAQFHQPYTGSLEVVPEETGTERNVVFNVTDGSSAITDAEVTIGSKAQTVDGNGQVTFNLYDGNYNYSATAPGYTAQNNIPLQLDADRNITVVMIDENALTAASSGIWSDVLGTTDEFDDIIIPSGIEISIPTTKIAEDCHNLKVEPGGMLTIEGTLDVHGALLVEASSTMSGSVVNKNTLNVAGDVKVQQHFATTSQSYNWHYVAAPVAGDTAGLFPGVDHDSEPGTADVLASEWNETSGAWEHITAPAQTLEVGKGYAIPLNEAHTVTYTGSNLVQGSQSYSGLGFHAGTYEGFHLVGNPFAAAIDATQLSENDGTHWTTDIWIRSNGGFEAHNVAGGSGTLNDNIIPAMQGFWIRNNGGGLMDLILDAASQVHSAHTVYKNEADNELHFALKKDGNADRAVIYIHPEATLDYEKYDTEKRFAGAASRPEVYTMAATKKVAVNGIAPVDEQISLSLGLKASEGGNFTFDFSKVNTFDKRLHVLLKDHKTGTLTDVRKSPEYEFYTDAVDNASRFSFFISQSANGIDLPAEDFAVYHSKGQINIQCDVVMHGTVQVYDVSGKRVFGRKVELLSGRNSFDFDKPQGVYLIHFYNEQIHQTRKMIIK